MRIAVTGTPGTGKTTVARELAKTLGYRYIDLGTFAVERGLAIEDDDERETKIIDEKELKELLKGKDDVVFDGHYAEMLDPEIVFVIRAPPKVLKERLSKRFNPEKVRENLLAEILDACLISAVERNEKTRIFEIENISRKKTMKKILELVEKGTVGESIAFKPTRRYLTEETLELL